MVMGEDSVIYRAKITKKYRGSDPFVTYDGPYTTAAAARARVTYWANYLADRDLDIDGTQLDESWATGEVEVGTVSWRRLES
jgi:hypothetical protein